MDQLNYATLKNYESFTSINEMDQAVRGFLYKCKSSLSDGALKVLHFLWRYSVKVVGVSFAKYDTIATGVSVSRRTVIRAVKALEEMNFIKKIPTARMNGKQGVNLYVIQPFEQIDSLLQPVSPQDVTAAVTPNKAENKQSSLCEKNHLNRMNVKKINQHHNQPIDLPKQAQTDEKLKPNPSMTEQQPNAAIHSVPWHQLDTSFLPNYVHQDFIQAAKAFFPVNMIHKLWTRIHLAFNKINPETPLDNLMETILFDFKQTVFKYKSGKIHSTFEGYFYKVVYSRLQVIQKQENRDNWYKQLLAGFDD